MTSNTGDAGTAALEMIKEDARRAERARCVAIVRAVLYPARSMSSDEVDGLLDAMACKMEADDDS